MNKLQVFSQPARLGCVLLALMAILLTPLKSIADEPVVINIKCSPAVVILDAVRINDCLTVHTDLSYNSVDKRGAVTLNGVEAYLLKSDNRGNLVAKFRVADLLEQLLSPATTLTLEGATVAGAVFTGSDTVRVIE